MYPIRLLTTVIHKTIGKVTCISTNKGNVMEKVHGCLYMYEKGQGALVVAPRVVQPLGLCGNYICSGLCWVQAYHYSTLPRAGKPNRDIYESYEEEIKDG